MTPSRLAFLQEFERDLDSISLRDWFVSARKREPVLDEFIDPVTLRGFLQTEERDPRKPQIWRALVRSVQMHPSPEAKLFVLGLLEPALGHMIDKVDEFDLDGDDLWQQTIACALRALANPQLPERRVVLVGLVKDTYKLLCGWLRRELTEVKGDESLSDLTVEPDLEGTEADFLLAVWCRCAGVTSRDKELIRATRIQGMSLSQLAVPRSPIYNRLFSRRYRAEQRLKAWLLKTDVASGTFNPDV
ncbi:MAG: hypothetical protein M3077_05930 [Candidatus Dormibacteraeota bacterium]|nr:hypothetical protein [Candidatus Dormibacteraeota bacterium]